MVYTTRRQAYRSSLGRAPHHRLFAGYQLTATKDIDKGTELTASYGALPMHDVLSTYGFAPATAAPIMDYGLDGELLIKLGTSDADELGRMRVRHQLFEQHGCSKASPRLSVTKSLNPT